MQKHTNSVPFQTDKTHLTFGLIAKSRQRGKPPLAVLVLVALAFSFLSQLQLATASHAQSANSDIVENLAVSNSLRFQHFNTDNGLPSNHVEAFLQDKHGFMWFGTS